MYPYQEVRQLEWNYGTFRPTSQSLPQLATYNFRPKGLLRLSEMEYTIAKAIQMDTLIMNSILPVTSRTFPETQFPSSFTILSGDRWVWICLVHWLHEGGLRHSKFAHGAEPALERILTFRLRAYICPTYSVRRRDGSCRISSSLDSTIDDSWS